MTMLASTMQGFFTQHLIAQRRASPHTVASYRDTCRLLLRFAHAEFGKAPSQLDFDDLERKYLKPASNRAILRRQMSNLKVAHEKHKQYELALSASERIQLVDPTNLRNLSELAHLQTKVGNFGDAVDSLTQFLERAPAGSNTEQAESALRKLKALTTRGSEDSSE